jgi:hypothetical protein
MRLGNQRPTFRIRANRYLNRLRAPAFWYEEMGDARTALTLLYPVAETIWQFQETVA